jgi:transglutaminase-like putative cysteine protease
MNIFDVRHKTVYRYRRNVKLGPHRLMVRPRASHALRLIATELSCSPPAEISWVYDVFGNSVATATFSAPTAELTVESRIRLELFAPDWPVFPIAPSVQSYPFAYTESDRIDLGAMLVPQYPDPAGRLQSWARAFVRGPATDTLALLKDLNAGVSAWISYQSRDDEGTQTPLETLSRGFGSCRDMALLMIEAARHLGFGARVVSGYLYNPSQDQNFGGASGSTHAWVEIFLPGAGWISFDPTNRTIGGSTLIPVAVARDLWQAAPISGSFVGTPGDCYEMAVTVQVTNAAARGVIAA